MDTHGQPDPWTALRKAKEKQNRKTQHKKNHGHKPMDTNPWTPMDTKIISSCMDKDDKQPPLMKNNK